MYRIGSIFDSHHHLCTITAITELYVDYWYIGNISGREVGSMYPTDEFNKLIEEGIWVITKY